MGEAAIRVASIGECMVELRHLSATELTMGFGGDTLNTAVYLARVGGDRVAVDYVTALGDDPYSDAMVEAWQREGVGTGRVRRLAGRMPGLYLIRTDAKGERTFHYYRSAAAARDMFAGLDAGAVAGILSGCGLVYLSGITLSVLDEAQRTALIGALDLARGDGARVAFDGNFRPAGWPDREAARELFTRVLRRVDIALPTFEDEQRLFGDADIPTTLARLHGLGVAEVVVKQGPDGAVVSAGHGAVPVPAFRVTDVVDTTAAGDSFNGGYLAARLLGKAPERAARIGHRVAAEVVRHRGAIIDRAAMPDLATL